MRSQLRPALVSLLLLTLITGVAYPVVVTGLAKLCFPKQANGSVIQQGGRAVGSDLIGQPFSDPKYFWPRPSVTAPMSYAAEAGSGSNLSPTNPALKQAVQQRSVAMREAHSPTTQPIPADLVTASGSGLDPHISVAAANYQLARVAGARGMPLDQLRRLVEQHTEQRTLGLLGEPRINVLKLNLALDGRL